MKLKAALFGRYEKKREIPGIYGTCSEIYVGQQVRGSHGRNPCVISSLELDRQAQMIIIRKTSDGGDPAKVKPDRCWTNNQAVEDRHLGDACGIIVGDATLVFEDEQPQAKK